MAATEDEGMDVDHGTIDAKQDYLRVACALQDRLRDVTAGTGDGASTLTEILEIAAKEFGIERDDHGKSKKRRKKSSEKSMGNESEEKGCEHSCTDHKELMKPNLWGTLPPELLPLVFSHLPVEGISRLQLLNKNWQQTILADSDFHRVCSEVYPKMICLINRDYHNLSWVRVLDLNCSKWHTYKFFAGRPAVDFTGVPFPIMIAECEDGGLVCFVTSWNMHSKVYSKKTKARSSLFFNVVNPLTRTSRVVPPLFDLQEMKLVQIQVDRRTREFKLFVVADKLVWTNASTGWTIAGVTAQVYDSMTGEWTTADECLPSNVVLQKYGQKVAYNFANGRLVTMDNETLSRTRTSSAFYKERLFVLKLGSDGPANDEFANESPTYFIEEFHWETVWVKAKTYRCEPFEHPPKTAYRMKLRASYGFLMVTAELSSHRDNERFENQLAWLYDLSTMKWSILDLPQLPVGRRTYDPYDRSMFTVDQLPGDQKLQVYYDATYGVDLMFEPQWGV